MTALRPEISDIEEIRFDGGNVLVNNAAATQRKPFLETTPEEWAPQMDVTVTGTLRITQAVARSMTARGSGAIVNLMGDSGRVGESGKKILTQYPLRRVGRPDDVTPMILLLASPLSGWTTGQVVSVNGGYAMV